GVHMVSLRSIAFLTVVVPLVPVAGMAHPKGNPPEALWAAVRHGDPKAVKALLEKGADVNAKNEIGITALWSAASEAKPEPADLLLGAGGDVNARDEIWYQTPLSLAVGGGQAEIVKRLLRAGAKDIDGAVI